MKNEPFNTKDAIIIPLIIVAAGYIVTRLVIEFLKLMFIVYNLDKL